MYGFLYNYYDLADRTGYAIINSEDRVMLKHDVVVKISEIEELQDFFDSYLIHESYYIISCDRYFNELLKVDGVREILKEYNEKYNNDNIKNVTGTVSWYNNG